MATNAIKRYLATHQSRVEKALERRDGRDAL